MDIDKLNNFELIVDELLKKNPDKEKLKECMQKEGIEPSLNKNADILNDIYLILDKLNSQNLDLK